MPFHDDPERAAPSGSAAGAVDPEAAAVARGAAIKRRLLEEVPTLTAAGVADLLGITPAGVRKARGEGRLLAVEYDGQRYPAFQFTADGVRRGVREVLAALDAVPVGSDWARLDLLTAPDAADDGRSVADLLRAGDVEMAVAVVSRYGEMGG